MAEPLGQLSPAQVYERRWAITLLNCVVSRLRAEFCEKGRNELFDRLEPRLWRDDATETYAELGVRLGMTEAAIKKAVSRLRERYRQLLREEIAKTVESVDQVDDELAYLRRVLGS